MTDRKSIKRALISSIVAILLCCTMLVGTTFAWFTDTVTTGINIIQSGNLDAVLEYATWDETTGTWTAYQAVEADKAVFENILWEPGATQVVKFQVKNAGTLAFKYELGMQVFSETSSTNVYGDEFFLSDYIKVGSGAEGADITNRAEAVALATKNINEVTNLIADTSVTLAAGTETHEYVFVINLPWEVDNVANHLTGVAAPEIQFRVVLLATQVEAEADSFGSDYDADATFPVAVTTTADLTAALAAGKDVVLSGNVALDSVVEVAGKDVVIYGNGNTLTVPQGGSRIVNADGQAVANVKLVNVNLDADGAERAISFYDNDEVNLELDSCTAQSTYYALNIAKNNDNVNLVITNSEITGYAAVNIYSTTKAIFKNCTLTGVNKYVDNGWNNFATIVIAEGADNCELVFENCTIVREMQNTATEFHVIDNAANTSITFTNCTLKTVQGGNTTVDAAAVYAQ